MYWIGSSLYYGGKNEKEQNKADRNVDSIVVCGVSGDVSVYGYKAAQDELSGWGRRKSRCDVGGRF
jgi:hypothetical protein